MTVSYEIMRLKENLINAYMAVENKSGSIPSDKNFNNLSASINTIENKAELESEVSIELDEINGEVI